MAGYQHPCRYCDALIPPDSNVCPVCGKKNPLVMRCPKCRKPIQQGWVACSGCGLTLKTVCPTCEKTTFFGDYCEHCGAELVVTCPNKKCKTVQPPIGEKCIKCGKPLQ